MLIWSAEIKELEKLYEFIKGQLPDLEKELEQLVRFDDPNVIMLYSRRCLEVVITSLCECELNRDRGTEPLKGVIDKLNKERKVPSHIITSMHGLNDMSTYGAHPKDFDTEQVKPVLVNLDIVIKWYLKYKNISNTGKTKPVEVKYETKSWTVSPPEKSIIVLPFENISPDPDQEYFSDGLTEEVITDLSHIHDLLVISRSSAMTFKRTKKKIKEIASEVNVRYVLEGSVRKAGNKLRITAQLIDGANDSHIWAEKYNGTLDDIFDIQEKVSQSISNALKIELSFQEKHKIHERSIDNVIAYDYYLKACQEIMTFSKDRIDNGLSLLQLGIDIVGENALIYAAIAYAHFQLANIGIEQENNINRAEEFAGKALGISPDLAEAHLVLANINFNLYGNPHKAIFHFNQAHNNKPDDPEIMLWLGVLFCEIGKTDAAMSLANNCIKIDPKNPYNYFLKGAIYFWKGLFVPSLELILEIYNSIPANGMIIFWKSLVMLYNNHPDNSYEFLKESVKEPGKDTLEQLSIFLKYIIKGDRDKLISLLTPDFVKAVKVDCQLSMHMATLYSYIGEKDKSLEWLENAVERGFINFPFLNEYDPLLENIRGEERFKKLMERVKYEWENFEV